MGNQFSQSFFIPKPSLTEKNLPDQSGKVFIVTGANVGCGYELSNILYSHHGTVYVAGRSEERCRKAISDMKATNPGSKGQLHWLKLDLADLTTIRATAEEFLGREKRLDFLCNNAGVMTPPKGSKTAQGYDLQIGTNCLGHWLLTHHLTPILKSTAASSTSSTVRIAWAGSLAIDFYAPLGGVTLDDKGMPDFENLSPETTYGVSKAGNMFMASEFSKRNPDAGIVSVVFNPGNLQTELQRHLPWYQAILVKRILCFPAIYGAYTELWCGFSKDLTTQHNGSYVAPWGRVYSVKPDRSESLRTREEGGSGKAKAFVDWCEKECQQYY